jgi:hypothetical protein
MQVPKRVAHANTNIRGRHIVKRTAHRVSGKGLGSRKKRRNNTLQLICVRDAGHSAASPKGTFLPP